MNPKNRRGIILVIVLGLLALIALLGVSFVTLQSMERRVTSNFAEQVRARLVAQSGMDYAVDRLSLVAREGWFRPDGTMDTSFLYGGATTNDTQIPTAALNVLHAPLKAARNPSFNNENDVPADPTVQDPYGGSTEARQLKIEGVDLGFSGWSGGTYGVHGDIYSLKVVDSQSQINVNEGLLYGSDHSSTRNLVRILNILGTNTISSNTLGDKLIYNDGTNVTTRPGNGYRNKQEIRVTMNRAGYSDADFEVVKDFLTVASWVNPAVANPVPLSQAEVDDTTPEPVYPIEYQRPTGLSGENHYRLGHQRNRFSGQSTHFGATAPVYIDHPTRPWPMRFFDDTQNLTDLNNTDLNADQLGWRSAIWSLNALNPLWIEQVERAPININTASREVLRALITDLQGFFVTDRRAPAPQDMFYGFLTHRYLYDPVLAGRVLLRFGNNPNCQHDFVYNQWHSKTGEYGHLVKTTPFGGNGSLYNSGTGGGFHQAVDIADHIIACRNGTSRASINYGSEAFGGPFKTWAQFNAFVDNLVVRQILEDPRGAETFYDYTANVVYGDLMYDGSAGECQNPAGKFWDVPTINLTFAPQQAQRASQAMADVLKANFNPNLHLNELNPDRNLWQEVDKTDLLVNSTEFCFVPMGTFEIESIGYVLEPESGSDALAVGVNNEIIAMKKISALVKLYDAEYRSTQGTVGNRQGFYTGEFSERGRAPATNNNRGIESGPEPDNGDDPFMCAWDGYLALPTVGAIWDDANTTAQKTLLETWTTAQASASPYLPTVTEATGKASWGPSLANEFLRVHLTLDYVASWHGSNDPQNAIPLGPRATVEETTGSSGSPGGAPGSQWIEGYADYKIDWDDAATIQQAKDLAWNSWMAVQGLQWFRNELIVTGTRTEAKLDGELWYEATEVYEFAGETRYRDRGSFWGTDPVGSRYEVDGTFTTWQDWMDEWEAIMVAELAAANPDWINIQADASRSDPHRSEFLVRIKVGNPHKIVSSGGSTPPPSSVQTGTNLPRVPLVPDPSTGDGLPGPYSPVLDPAPPLSETFTAGSAPTGVQKYAPKDLRIDGGYADPNAAFGYTMENVGINQAGAVEFWYKPSYFPESTSRIRSLFSLRDYDMTAKQVTYPAADLSYPLPFNLYFLPSYHSAGNPFPAYGEPGRPASLLWAIGASREKMQSEWGGGIGFLSPTLNHEYTPYTNPAETGMNRFMHNSDANLANRLRHHEWHHVIVYFGASGTGSTWVPDPDSEDWTPALGADRVGIYVNGQSMAAPTPAGQQLLVHVDDAPDEYQTIHGDVVRFGGEFGGLGWMDTRYKIRDSYDNEAVPQIYYGDGTIDEIYMYRGTNADLPSLTEQRAHFEVQGRYYRGGDDTAESVFTSRPVNLTTQGRILPQASTVTKPPSSESLTPPTGVSPDNKLTILAVAWTAYGEEHGDDGSGNFIAWMNDHLPVATGGFPTRIPLASVTDNTIPGGTGLPTVAPVSIVVDDGTTRTAHGEFTREGWSPVRTSAGDPVLVDWINGEDVMYQVRLRTGNLDSTGAILLATPVFDDITIFYNYGHATYLYYSEMDV